jgi:hypothetical protein
MTPQIQLRPISEAAAEALADGRVPTDVRVEHDGVPLWVRRWELVLQ